MLGRRTALALATSVTGTLLTLVPGAPAQAAVSNLTVLGPLVTLKADDATPAGASGADLTVARNEFESFQVAVRADGNGIGRLEVEAGDLTGALGGTLPASALTVYREMYFKVSADHLSDGESTVGQWPDALVPQVDPIYGQKRGAFNTAVPANGRVVLWVDVLAGRGQAPDTYTGNLRVKDGTTVVGTVPVRVTVRNSPSPRPRRWTASSSTSRPSSARSHTGSGNCNGNVDEANRLSAVYERVALENRITISTPWQIDRSGALTGAMQTSWRQQVLPIINGTAAPASVGSPIRLPGAKATNLVLWHYCKAACIDSWKAQAATDGFADRLQYYTCDEPNQCRDHVGRLRRQPLRRPVQGPARAGHHPAALREGQRRRLAGSTTWSSSPGCWTAATAPSRATSARRTTPGRPTRPTARRTRSGSTTPARPPPATTPVTRAGTARSTTAGPATASTSPPRRPGRCPGPPSSSARPASSTGASTTASARPGTSAVQAAPTASTSPA